MSHAISMIVSTLSFSPSGLIQDRLASVFELNQSRYVDAVGMIDSAVRIAGGDHDRPMFGKKTCGMFAHRTETLDHYPGSLKVEAAEFARDFDARF
jgi:hypothetical protein